MRAPMPASRGRRTTVAGSGSPVRDCPAWRTAPAGPGAPGWRSPRRRRRRSPASGPPRDGVPTGSPSCCDCPVPPSTGRSCTLVHIDTKKFGRIVGGPGHRVTGDRRSRSRGAGWTVIHAAIDDAWRVAYVELLPDECGVTASGFLRRMVAHLRGQRGAGAAGAHGQREPLRLWSIERGVRGPGRGCPPESAGPATDEREGRALVPDRPARMPLPPPAGERGRAPTCIGRLREVRQPSPTAPRHQGPHPPLPPRFPVNNLARDNDITRRARPSRQTRATPPAPSFQKSQPTHPRSRIRSAMTEYPLH